MGNGTAVFDLNALAGQVNNQPGVTVNWFFDINAQTPIPSPYNTATTTVYAVATNGGCNSQPAAVDLIVENAPIANNTITSACDLGNGTAVFDLNALAGQVNNQPGITVNWFFDINAQTPIPSPYNTATTTVYAVASNGGCNSQPAAVDLIVESSLTANNAFASACDLGNGTATFDLTLLESEVNSNGGLTFSWYADPNATTPIPTIFTTPTTIVYVVVSDGACASPPTLVSLTVEEAPTANSVVSDACDSGNNTSEFDLSAIAMLVNSNPTYAVSWFLSPSATNQLMSPFVTSSTSVYAVVSGSGCSSPPTEVLLNVLAAPVGNPTSATECEISNGQAIFNLTNLESTVNGGTNDPVTWFSDINASVAISSPYTTGTTVVYAVVTGSNSCSSVPVAVDLIVSPLPVAVSTSYTECDLGNGTANFNLTSIENTVNGGTGFSVLWYADNTTNNPITSPFNSGTTTVFAVVDDGTCTSQPTAVTLTVDNQISANPTSATECDEGGGTATFELLALENIINGNSGNNVTWYADPAATIDISAPFFITGTTTVYATVGGGNCVSAPVAVDLTVASIPTANPTTTNLCDEGNGMAQFIVTDLNETVNNNTMNSVNWYADANASTLIPSLYSTGTTTVFAIVSDGTCESEPTPVNLIVDDLPIATSTSAQACDEGNSTATFALTDLENIVNGGSGNSVEWFTNANATNAINPPFTTSSTTIFVVVDDGICTSIPASVDLTVIAGPEINDASAEACDEGNGTATFDLTALESTVNGGTTNPVTWYSNAGATNQIFSPYNTSSATIYAIVDDGSACPSPVEAIDLTVLNLPAANSASDTECGDANGLATFDLDVLANAVNSANNVTVSWFSDINLNSPITSPTYTTIATTIYAVVDNGTCQAAAVPVTLNISNSISANPTNLATCDDNSGNNTGIFDLTSIENDITGGNAYTISWFTNPAATIPVSPPLDAYISTSTSLYATVASGNCTSDPVEISLTVLGEISVFQASSTECDDGNGIGTFNLDAIGDNVTGGNGNDVLWYSDAALTMPISSPFISAPTTIFAVATDGNCLSNVVEVILNVVEGANGNETSASACDDGTGTATFNLDALAQEVNSGVGVNFTIEWFSNQNLTNQIFSPYTTATTTVFAIVSNNLCASDPIEVDLEVVTELEAFPTTSSECDEGNGTATFDLDELASEVNGGNSTAVVWSTDPNLVAQISSPYVSADATIYAATTDGTCFSDAVEVTLIVASSIPAFPAADSACDEGNGTAIFPLTNLENTINGGSGVSVNFYEDDNLTIPITPPLTSIANTIYAVAVDGNCTSAPVEVELSVINLPVANSTSTSACEVANGEALFNLNSLASDVNGGNGNTVDWYSDENATDDIPSQYTSATTTVYATVTDAGCTSNPVAVSLTVIEAPVATTTMQVQCDEGNGEASFDLTALNSTVNGGTGNPVTWYSNANATNLIPSPYVTSSTNVYAVVSDGICESAPVAVSLEITNTLDAFSTTDTQCDLGNGTAIFDLDLLDDAVNGGTGFAVDWYFSADAINPIQTLYTSSPTTVYAVVVDGICISTPVPVELMVTALGTTNPAMDAECGNGSGIATFELTNLESTINGGNGNTITWFEDVNTTIPITPPFTTPTATIYAVSTNDNCPSAPIAVDLDVTPLVSANPASNIECDDGSGTATFDVISLENTINGGTGFDVLWYEDANLTVPFTPTNAFTSTSTNLYAVVDDGECTSLPVEISLMVAADVNSSPASMTLCNDGNDMANFDLDEIVDIVNQGTGNAVLYFEDVNLTIPITSPYNTSSTTIYAISQLGNCDSDPVEITLTVLDAIPAISTTASLCDEGNGEATFDLTTLENTVNDNTSNQVSWYEDANATIPIGTSITTGATSVFAQTTDGTCPSQVVEIQLSIAALPVATPTSTSLCDEGNGEATFDLTTLENIVNGGTTSTVSWFEDSNATIPLGTSITSGATSIFATINNGICNSEVVEIELAIDALPPAFPTNTALCDEGNGEATFDLSPLENTINDGGTNTVLWFEDSDLTTPISTTITTTTTSVFAVTNDGTCNSEVVEINLTVDALPQAVPTSTVACNNGNDTGDFELTSLENTVNANINNVVTWFEDSNATIPASTTLTTVSTSVFAIVDDGTCVSNPVEIQLIVDDPVPAFPTVSSECDSGNGEATFDLSSLENTVNGNSTNTVAWFEDSNATNPIGTSITTAANSVFAIVNDGTCNSTVVEVQLQIDTLPDAFTTGTSLCDDGSGTADFDLTLLENNVAGGNGNTVTWFDDPNGNNPIATSINTASTSVFASVSDGTCVSDLVEVELTIDPFSTNAIVETLCFGESMIVNNQVYDQNNASGTEITQAANGCDSIITIDLSFEAEVIGSIAASTPLICPGGNATLTFSLTGGTTFDVQYALGNNPPITLNGISDGHTITVAPTGTTTYNLVSVSPVGSVCTGTLPTNQVTIEVQTMNALAQAVTDFNGFNVSCFDGNDGIAVAGTTSGITPFDYQWSNGDVTPVIIDLAAGTYTVTITDSTGCVATTSVTLTEPSEIDFTTIPVGPPCTDAFDGEILLEDVSGGVGPYTFSFNDNGFNPVDSSTMEIDFVLPGSHIVTVMDENGCEISQEVTIFEPEDATVDLGPDQTLELGDSIELQPVPNFNITEIIWSSNAPCADCPSQFVTPVNQSTYLVTMLDESGCIATDTITIFVEKPRRVYIPNAFSPDDNGMNDIFFINAGQEVANVRNFKIFNRWGALLFSQENFQPNDDTYGWDGFYKNKKLNPGVYVYFAEIEFIDGQVVVYKGDVTLVR
ncbi:MAG: gliding motility-associated C-terminal domain-containing protein [Bacteroidota bacterium]